MKYRLLTAALASILAAFPAAAQFYTLGSEPASVRWSSIETPTYRLIYPNGLDSLARVYALHLEQAAALVGEHGRLPSQPEFQQAHASGAPRPHRLFQRTRELDPRRVELMTMPDPDWPEPTPWETQLTIHESRHVAQMQYTAARPFRGWTYLTGQLVSGALAALYCGPAFFEGDAVVAETALTRGGRGRTADFLEYFRVSFAEGGFRNYWRWRYGSQRLYTPDYYRIGYITAAGVRSIYDTPDFTARYYQRIADHGGVTFNNFSKTIEDISGKKLDAAFTEIRDSLRSFWNEDDARRAPFMASRSLTSPGKRYTELNGLTTLAGGRMFAVRSGITVPHQLVEISPTVRSRFSETSAPAAPDPNTARPREGCSGANTGATPAGSCAPAPTSATWGPTGAGTP